MRGLRYLGVKAELLGNRDLPPGRRRSDILTLRREWDFTIIVSWTHARFPGVGPMLPRWVSQEDLDVYMKLFTFH